MNEEFTLSPRKLIKLSIVGDHKIGKTTIINSLVNVNNCPLHITSTTSPDMHVKFYNVNSILYRLQIWDTMGHPYLIPLNKYCYQNIDSLIIVFDVSNRRSFENINLWYEQYIEYSNPVSNSKLPLLILLGNIRENKCRVIFENEAKMLAKKYNMIYYELFANNIKSVDDTFHKILNELIIYLFSPKQPTYIVDNCCLTPREKLLKQSETVKPNRCSCFTKCFFSD
jgi:small GTP-binding protein